MLPVVSAEGASEDLQVSVTVTAGRLTGCVIDPRAMRLSNAELSSKFVEATNRALATYADEAVAAWQGQGTDFAGMQEELRSIGQQAQQTMETYLSGMKQMLDQAGERGRQP